jgi:hypothetical protein
MTRENNFLIMTKLLVFSVIVFMQNVGAFLVIQTYIIGY